MQAGTYDMVEVQVLKDMSGQDKRTARQLVGLLVAYSLAPRRDGHHSHVLHTLTECVVRKPNEGHVPLQAATETREAHSHAQTWQSTTTSRVPLEHTSALPQTASRVRFSPAELQQRLLAEVDLLEDMSSYHHQVRGEPDLMLP
jgi:hypothetical protein